MSNRTLKEDLRRANQKVFQLQVDLDTLRVNVEDNLPFFNALEFENQQLKHEVALAK